MPLVDPDERFSAIALGPVPLPNGDTDGASWWSIDTETTQRDSASSRRRSTLEALIADEAVAARFRSSGATSAVSPRVGIWRSRSWARPTPPVRGVWAIRCGLPEFAACVVSSGDGRPALVQWAPVIRSSQPTRPRRSQLPRGRRMEDAGTRLRHGPQPDDRDDGRRPSLARIDRLIDDDNCQLRVSVITTAARPAA